MSGETPAAQPPADAARLSRVAELRKLEEVAPLIAMLPDPSWLVRREVVSALSALGEAALEPLAACLQTERGDEARIAATVDALVSSSAERADPTLIALANRLTEPAVLADLAQILGRRHSRAAYETLSRLSNHADDNVAVSAIEALGRLGGRAAVDTLIACVQSRNFFRTFPAIDVLGRSGDPRAIEPLSQLLADSRYAPEAARALGRSADRRAVPPLTALLVSASESIVRVASLALIELCDRHAQLYGAANVVHESLRRAGSEAIVRRLAQSVARADKAEKIAICRLLGELKLESATPALLSLVDGDPEVGEAAGKALREIGRASEGALIRALLEGDGKRRRALLPAVVHLSSAEAVLACLADANAEVRVLACSALARIGATGAVPALFARLRDDNQRVVHAAISAIQSLGSDRTEPLALAAAREPSTHRSGLRVLAYFGFPGALPVFEDALGDGDPRARDAALHGLSLLERPEARALLLRATEHQDGSARAAAIRALGQLPPDGELDQRLLQGLSDGEPWVRYYACQALGKRQSRALAGPLQKLLEDDAGQVRVAAIEALSHTGSPEAVQVLRAHAQHADLDLRRAALVGLGLARDEVSVPLLLDAAQRGDSATRLVALSTLATFADARVVPVLKSVAHDPLETLRAAAINLLAERAGSDAASALVELLACESERSLVCEALAAALEDRLPALLAALQVADDDSALLLVSCLSRSRARGAEAALYQTLSSPNPAARKAGVGALAALATQEARSAIEQLSQRDPEPDVRRTCLSHLA